METNQFDFNWKYGEFEIRTTKSIGDGQPYVELVKWTRESSGRAYCFTLAYWYFHGNEPPELHFVGDRPFTEIAEIDIGQIWRQLWLAGEMFDDWYRKERDA